MIVVNRREYTGSTPYTKAELDVFAQGSDEQRLNLLLSEGTNLALCLEGLIHSLSLQEVVIVGWSLGNLFTLSLLASISSLPQGVRERLALSVHRIIMWGERSVYYLSRQMVILISKRTTDPLSRCETPSNVYSSNGPGPGSRGQTFSVCQMG